MTLATFAIIFSAFGVISSAATLIYAVRIRKFVSDVVHDCLYNARVKAMVGEQMFKDYAFDVEGFLNEKFHKTLADLGLEKKPEQFSPVVVPENGTIQVTDLRDKFGRPLEQK